MTVARTSPHLVAGPAHRAVARPARAWRTRFAHCCRGATAVEFSMTIFPFLMAFYGVLEVMIFLYTASQASAAVADTSRYLRFANNPTLSDTRSYLCDRMPGIVNCTDMLVGIEPVSSVTQGNLAQGFTLREDELTIFTVQYDWPAIFPITGTYLDWSSGNGGLVSLSNFFWRAPRQP